MKYTEKSLVIYVAHLKLRISKLQFKPGHTIIYFFLMYCKLLNPLSLSLHQCTASERFAYDNLMAVFNVAFQNYICKT